MAFPPTIPTNTRSDSTVQQTNHANDHNLIANALADISAHLQTTISFQPADWLGSTQAPTDSRFPASSFAIFNASSLGGTNQNYPRSGIVFAVRATQSLVVQLLIPANNASGVGPLWRAGSASAGTWEPWRKLYDGSEP